MRAFSEGCSFQQSCTIFRTRCFSVFTWLHCNKAIASLRQNCKLSVWVFSMTSRNSSDISTSSLLRLQRMILLRASVAICSGANHIRLLCSVDSVLPCRWNRKAGISAFSFSKKSVSSDCNDEIFLTQYRVSPSSMMTGSDSLLEHSTNLAKKEISFLSLPLASTLYERVVLRFFNRSESSLRLSNTSSTTISSLPAQSELN